MFKPLLMRKWATNRVSVHVDQKSDLPIHTQKSTHDCRSGSLMNHRMIQKLSRPESDGDAGQETFRRLNILMNYAFVIKHSATHYRAEWTDTLFGETIPEWKWLYGTHSRWFTSYNTVASETLHREPHTSELPCAEIFSNNLTIVHVEDDDSLPNVCGRCHTCETPTGRMKRHWLGRPFSLRGDVCLSWLPLCK